MDPDALRKALRRWREDGAIDDATADRIREIEGLDGPPRNDAAETDDAATRTHDGDPDGTGDDRTLRDRRVVVALALMGGALVAVGVGAFLLEWWDAIPVPARVLLLLGVPLTAAVAGLRLGEASPRTAHGLWLLAALFAGVTLLQLAELAPFLDQAGVEPWLLLAWTTVAFGIATGLDSRPIGGLGAILGAATLLAAIDPSDPTALVGLYGSVVYAAGLFAADRGRTDAATPRLAATLRWLGGGFAIVALALIATLGSAVGRGAETPIDAGTVVVGLVAAGAAAVAVGRARDRAARYAVAPAVAAPVGVAVAWSLATGIGVGEVPSALVALACLLGLLIALVVAAVGLREAALVNVAALGFVLGVLSFLVGPIVDVVSGPLALVAAGLLLLGVGLGAERGRRELLGRIR